MSWRLATLCQLWMMLQLCTSRYKAQGVSTAGTVQVLDKGRHGLKPMHLVRLYGGGVACVMSLLSLLRVTDTSHMPLHAGPGGVKNAKAQQVKNDARESLTLFQQQPMSAANVARLA